MSSIEIFKLVVQLLPMVIELIKLAEQVIGPGQGPAKLEMVKGVLRNTLSGTEKGLTKFVEIEPQLTNVITSTVSSLNQAGILKKDYTAGLNTLAGK